MGSAIHPPPKTKAPTGKGQGFGKGAGKVRLLDESHSVGEGLRPGREAVEIDAGGGVAAIPGHGIAAGGLGLVYKHGYFASLEVKNLSA